MASETFLVLQVCEQAALLGTVIEINAIAMSHRISQWFLLERFLLAEALRPTLVGVAGGTVLLTAGRLFELADKLVVEGIEPLTVLQLLVLDIPTTVVLAMPVAALFSTMLTLGKLSSNSELTALRSVGVPFRRIFGPILLLGLILSAISYSINDGLVPLTKQRIRTLDRFSILAETNPVQNRDVFIKTPENIWMFVKQVNPKQNSMQDVTVLEVNPTRAPDESPLRGVIHARQASWDGESWMLRNGVAHDYSPAGIAIAETPFDSQPLDISADLATLMQPEIAPAELTSLELRQQIQSFSTSNLPTAALRTEWHLRFSLPLASFFAIIIAAPLAIRPARRAGRFNSIAFAIVLVFVYYVMLSISRSLGEAGAIAPWLASWSHNIAFGSVGSLLMLRYLR